MTAKEMASYLKVTVSTIRKLASEGNLPEFRIGKSWRFHMDDIPMLVPGREIDGRPDLAFREK